MTIYTCYECGNQAMFLNDIEAMQAGWMFYDGVYFCPKCQEEEVEECE